MPKKSKFIKKKDSVSFHLVHRSQQDPLTADESAPQRVLLPVVAKSKTDPKKQKEEERKYGIFFDDDYNYLQHVRDTNNTMEWEKIEKATPKPANKLKLPSSVFASEVEEKVGLLNKAAPHSGPRLDLDPDIIAAMDEDFDYADPENELEDNFIELANDKPSDDDSDSNCDQKSDFDSNFEEDDEVGSLDGPQFTFKEEETKSRFTNYSMSSSVIRRNEQLTLLDDKFEKMYVSYDDIEIGSLDCDEIEGHIPGNSDILLQYADEFQKQKKREQLDKDGTISVYIKQAVEADSEEEEFDVIKVPEKAKWDCQSYLSTLSNKLNHPKTIPYESTKRKIKVNSRTGIPVIEEHKNKLTKHALAEFNQQNAEDRSYGPKSFGGQSRASVLSALSIRPKDETLEEKRRRKQDLKEFRRERRKEKKINTLAFKTENKKQIKIEMNDRNNKTSNKIFYSV